ncbi:hypothetical protein J6590_011030 [Homalodisca vitripennis]|nr:hypothetical protein J6590_011030 [Homalodisca vitripennis]
MSLIDFKLDMCTASFDSIKSKKRKGRPSQDNEGRKIKQRAHAGCSKEVTYDGEGHFPKTTIAVRCIPKESIKRTKRFYFKCDIDLCPECINDFHTSL